MDFTEHTAAAVAKIQAASAMRDRHASKWSEWLAHRTYAADDPANYDYHPGQADFGDQFARHTIAALDQLAPPVQGPDADWQLCDCQHDRGSHWDGAGKCGYCPCSSFTLVQ